MKRNQTNLSDRPIEKNREFLKVLYGKEDLQGAGKWFDKLDCSVSAARQDDPDMNLEKYLGMMTDSFHIALQVGSPFQDEIRYCARGSDDQGVSRFAWMECPYNEHNYGVVSTLFKEVYGQEIESISAPELSKQPLTPLDKSVSNLITDGRFIFSPGSCNASLSTRVQAGGIPWDSFQNTTGKVEYIGIFQFDQSGELAAYYGDVHIHSVDGNVVLEDRTKSGGSHKLSEVPKPILVAVIDALKTDRNAYGPHCYQLYHAEYTKVAQKS